MIRSNSINAVDIERVNNVVRKSYIIKLRPIGAYVRHQIIWIYYSLYKFIFRYLII